MKQTSKILVTVAVPAILLTGVAASPAQAASAPLGCGIKIKAKVLNQIVNEYKGSGKCGKQKLTVLYRNSGLVQGKIGNTTYKLWMTSFHTVTGKSKWKGKLGKKAIRVNAVGKYSEVSKSKGNVTTSGTLTYNRKKYTFKAKAAKTSNTKTWLVKKVNYKSTSARTSSGKALKKGTTARTLISAYLIAAPR